MDFKNIIGHKQQLEFLERNLQEGNLAHAYLLAGPADIGKFTIAKIFAKMIQTEELEVDEAYALSTQIEKGVHLDTMVFPKGEEDSIKIEMVRGILNNLQMSGTARYRVLVIEEIERLTPEAANAMLKMLEEPPSKVIYVFTSSKPDLILETIMSRVRRIDFGVLNEEELLNALSNRFRLEDKQQLGRVASLAMGRVAKALKLMENKEILETYEKFYLEIKGFLKNKEISKGFGFIGQIHNDPLLTRIFIDLSFTVMREELWAAINGGDEKILKARVANIEKLFELKKLAETNVNNRLLLENFILSI
jgi:DNA polymerase-3 subunit delta'